MRVVNITAAVLLVGATASAQDEPARRAAAEVAARVPLEAPTKGAPYSADTIVEGTQSLADGNRINRKTTGRVFRDGEGRTRREEDRPNGAVTISITDPVAGFSYSLDAKNKVAWRTPMGTSRVILDKVEATWVQAARADAEKRVAEVTAAGGGRGVATTTNPAGASAGAGGGGGVQTVTGSYTRMAMPTMAPTPAGPLEHKILEGIPVEGRKTTTT